MGLQQSPKVVQIIGLRMPRYKILNLKYRRDRKDAANAVIGFTGSHSFLSNFAPAAYTLNGVRFHCSEQGFMYYKDTSAAYRARLLRARTPQECKRIGRHAKLVKDWDSVVRYQAMFLNLRAKFRDPVRKQLLLLTGNAYLEEANTWRDTHWGTCNGLGENHLGRLLMCVRYILQKED